MRTTDTLLFMLLLPSLAWSAQASHDHPAGHDMHAMPAPALDAHHSHAAGHHPPAVAVPAGPALPTPSAADRLAAFPDLQAPHAHARALNGFLLLDQLEYQDRDEGSTLGWNLEGWLGGDIDRLWLRAEGERTNGETDKAETQLLWGHAIGPWWDLLAGLRQDAKPGHSRTWAAFGLQGMPLYGLETEATLYLGEHNQAALRLEADYDILITNRLILQASGEVEGYTRNEPQRRLGSGLASSEFGLRLRYELSRQFAPYVGLSWERQYGNSARLSRNAGHRTEQGQWVAGIRMWF